MAEEQRDNAHSLEAARVQDEAVPDSEDDIESIDDDDFDLIQNIGEDPLMEPVQNALFKQLTTIHERVSHEIQDAQDENKRTKQEREQVGVRLYGVQQQLAKLQLQVEEVNSNFVKSSKSRSKAEKEIENAKNMYEGMRMGIKQEEDKLETNRKEFEALNQTLRSVDQYNEEMKSEIAVIRRAAYKAEENVSVLEQQKQEQDLYVDALQEQLKQLEEQVELYDAQILAQQKETEEANKTLRDANKEKLSIEFEKKQLLQQWKSSLVGLQRRDEALQATHEVIQEQIEHHVVLRTEIEGTKREISKCQSKNEVLMELKLRLVHDTKQVTDQIKAINKESNKLNERLKLMKRSLEHTDASVQVVEASEKALKLDIKAIESNTQVVQREKIAFEEEIEKNVGEQTTANEAVKNLVRDAIRLQEMIHELEIEYAGKENELARVKVDCLNTKAYTDQLQRTLDDLLEELKEQDKLIEKYQVEIRQRNDEVEKKMYIVDRLNRKYEALTANLEEENLGPLEATIKNLQKQTVSLNRQNRDIERQWLKHQTELVKVVNIVDQVNNCVHELKSREAILQQKKIRLDAQIKENGNEVKKLDAEIVGMHNDISKLNELLCKNKQVHDELANDNFVLEADFVEELKALERDSLQVDSQIQEVNEAKRTSMEKIVEIEEELMLWEKRIELEKETQAVLDPNVGQGEVQSMQKEIHRMQIRYDSLLREREKLLKDMELAIYKHDAISLRHHGKKTDGTLTERKLKHRLNEGARKLRDTEHEVQQYEQLAQEKVNESEAVGMEIAKLTSKYRDVEERANSVQQEINSLLFEKQRKINAINKQMRLSQRYRDYEAGLVKVLSSEATDTALHAAQEKIASIEDTIHRLQYDFPHLDDVLARVSHLLEV